MLDVLTSRRLGAPVYLAERPEILFPVQLSEVLETRRITVLYSAPTVLRMMHAHGGLAERDLSALRWILFTGEIFPPRALAELMADVLRPRYANLYGPTETNVVCWEAVTAAPSEDRPPSIGRPCPHSEVIICDRSGSCVETGETGEICVAGPTVMAGYWNRPELNRERFIRGDRMVFRTGDIGYWEADGSIRFRGRRDPPRAPRRSSTISCAHSGNFRSSS